MGMVLSAVGACLLFILKVVGILLLIILVLAALLLRSTSAKKLKKRLRSPQSLKPKSRPAKRQSSRWM